MFVQSISTDTNAYLDFATEEQFDRLKEEIELRAGKLTEKKNSFFKELDEMQKTPCLQFEFSQRAHSMLSEIEGARNKAKDIDDQFQKATAQIVIGLGVNYYAFKCVGGPVMAGIEATSFAAENEAALCAAADRLPQQFSDPERRMQLGCDGPTPEGAGVIGKALTVIAAPIGHIGQSIIQTGVEKATAILQRIVEQSASYNLSKEPT